MFLTRHAERQVEQILWANLYFMATCQYSGSGLGTNQNFMALFQFIGQNDGHTAQHYGRKEECG